MKHSRALTLIELMITISMLVVVVGVSVYVFRAVLLSFSGMEAMGGMDIVLSRGIEEMVRDFREAQGLDALNDDEIRFTKNSSDYYIYYLHNDKETYPSDFSEEEYSLRKAELTGGITGTFTYGDGKVILNGVLPPSTTDLSVDGNMITVDISLSLNGETARGRTEVRPRNL